HDDHRDLHSFPTRRSSDLPSFPMPDSNHRTSVLIAEDDALLRHFLQQLFVGQDDFEVVGTAASGWEALTAVEQQRPRVLLLDLGDRKSTRLNSSHRTISYA